MLGVLEHPIISALGRWRQEQEDRVQGHSRLQSNTLSQKRTKEQSIITTTTK
jgi:hypothetical protein